VTAGQLLDGATSRELRDALEYDALEPPLTRNDLEDFMADLIAMVYNAGANRGKKGLRAQDVYPAVGKRDEERQKALAKAAGKPFVPMEERVRRNRMRFAAITLPIEAAWVEQHGRRRGK
jgi:hypothetical protein